MDFKTNGVYMGFFQKILCILTALAIYPATIVIPKQDSFDRQIIFPQERRVFEIKQYESYAERNKQIEDKMENLREQKADEAKLKAAIGNHARNKDEQQAKHDITNTMLWISLNKKYNVENK